MARENPLFIDVIPIKSSIDWGLFIATYDYRRIFHIIPNGWLVWIGAKVTLFQVSKQTSWVREIDEAKMYRFHGVDVCVCVSVCVCFPSHVLHVVHLE